MGGLCWDNGKKMETPGPFKGVSIVVYVGVMVQRLWWDNGKENGNY